MLISLQQIKDKKPCKSGWETLLKSKGKTKADKDLFPITDILDSNGLDDAVWCLRCFEYKDYCLFLADVAESVLHIYEENNASKAPRDAINAIRDYHAGKISKGDLDAAVSAAYAVSDAAAAAVSAVSAAARNAKKLEIEALFVKYFGE